jgi:hypothetical protein
MAIDVGLVAAASSCPWFTRSSSICDPSLCISNRFFLSQLAATVLLYFWNMVRRWNDYHSLANPSSLICCIPGSLIRLRWMCPNELLLLFGLHKSRPNPPSKWTNVLLVTLKRYCKLETWNQDLKSIVWRWNDYNSLADLSDVGMIIIHLQTCLIRGLRILQRRSVPAPTAATSMSSSSPPYPTIQHIISKGAKVILSSHLVSSQPSRFSSYLRKQCSSHA